MAVHRSAAARAGTENVASIVGLSVALENAINTMDEKNAKLRRMQDKLITELSKIDRSHLNGDPATTVCRAT